MSLYYNTTGALREFDDAYFDALVAVNNPKAQGWTKCPPQPSYDAETYTIAWDAATSQWVVSAKPAAALADAEAWQVRVWMIRNGIDPATVPSIIEGAIPAGAQRDEALARWEYAVRVPADNALVAVVASGLGLTVAEVWPDILAI